VWEVPQPGTVVTYKGSLVLEKVAKEGVCRKNKGAFVEGGREAIREVKATYFSVAYWGARLTCGICSTGDERRIPEQRCETSGGLGGGGI